MPFKRFLYVLFVVTIIGGITFILLMETSNFSVLHGDFGARIPKKYPILGIDISHHQGQINYTEAVDMVDKADSVQFVYIKVTEGVDFIDPNYEMNAEGFAGENLNYGFYHFYQPGQSAKKQAQFFCDEIWEYNFKLIPVLDVELNEPLNKKQLVDSITIFLDEVDKQLKVRPMVYTYWYFYRDFLKTTTLKNELYWIASYSGNNDFMKMDNVVIWQFSERGTVSGIQERVDLNVAKKSFNTLVLRPRYR